MNVKITTLTENTAGRNGMMAEHGLSIFVEAGDRRILLDTGQTYTAVHNARALGVDLNEIDIVVLSHGHADHTGGLREVLRSRRGRGIDVVAHPSIWEPRWAVREGEEPRYAGIPLVREEMEEMGARFHLATGPVQLARASPPPGRCRDSPRSRTSTGR